MQQGKFYFPYSSDTTLLQIKELREVRILINNKRKCKSGGMLTASPTEVALGNYDYCSY